MRTALKRHPVWEAMAVLLWLTVIATGCASQRQEANAPAAAAQPSAAPAKHILGIVAERGPEMDRIRILGNQTLTFTSVPQASPPGVVLYLPQTTLALEAMSLEALELSPIIAEVHSGEQPGDSTTARVEILLKQDSSYEATREGNDVIVSFARPAAAEAPAVVSQTANVPSSQSANPVLSGPPATMMTDITAQRLENGVELRIQADGPIKDYASFTLRDPDRIVYDLYGVGSPYKKEQTIAVNTQWVARVRHYGDGEKLRVVLDSSADNFEATTAMPIQDGLLIHVGQVAQQAEAMATPATSSVAWVNRIDFSAEPSGKSVVIVGTTSPVDYDLEKVNDRRLELKLAKAQIPGFRRRPLLTTRFESAVDRVIPVQSDQIKDTGLITIELREAVPYTVEQVENLIMVHFDASNVPPKPEDRADLPGWQQVVADAVSRESAGTTGTADSTAGGIDNSAFGMSPSKTYTGEKIALDFYETDIKNVFRILREVSGKNFAIDQDVRGMVTLTLDKPVPWDQVLDLILKMNQLGMTHEGDIIRIATVKTLQQEEKLRQDSLAEKQKSLEQQQNLEPLVTEYIAVNYSNAKSDILPHLEKLITKDRGSVSVHEATNQIIIKDTATKIASARALVKELDKVTPQVLIEARIVEARKSFSSQLGAEFGIGPGTGAQFSSATLGGDWDLSLSSNFPKASGSGITFDFTRLVGSPLAINAAIDASESEGLTKTISAPKILTLDNKAATIKQGTSYPINKLDQDGNSTTEFKDIVLELQVTPHVTLDSRVSMNIKITKNDLGAMVGNNFSFTVNEANTELLVNDGDTVVIGGITKTTEQDGQTGLPGLRKIPLIGWLFGNKTESEEKEELLIFITPRIVSLDAASN